MTWSRGRTNIFASPKQKCWVACLSCCTDALSVRYAQAERYALALETLEKGVITWEDLQGGGEGDHEPSDPERGLEASDEASFPPSRA